LQLTCGGVYVGDTTGGSREVFGYPCSSYDYSGGEAAHRVRVPFPTTVTAHLSGLTADLDLVLLQPAEDSCDSSTCTHISDASGTSPEVLAFPAVPGMTYDLLVDGYEGAEGPYTLQIDCAHDPIGDVADSGGLLEVHHDESGTEELELFWDAACGGAGEDYAVYMGVLGDWYTHEPVMCSTGGATWHRRPVPEGDVYFLVAAHNGVWEGSHGLTSDGVERPQGMVSCVGSPLPDHCF
jgi:hypothetical protein